MFGTSKAVTPEEYINELDEPRRTQIAELDKIIRESVPDLERFMIAGMIGYGPYHYTYASGREGDWAVLSLANQKNYMSFYVCAAKDGQYLAEANKSKLPKASIGKSCIRFKKLEDLDLEVIRSLCREAAAWTKAGNFAV